MTWGEIINLIASLIIIWFVFSQKKKVELLETAVSSQKNIIEDMKCVVDTFRAPIELHDKIVDMYKEESELGKNKALAEFKAKANKGIAFALHEMEELLGLSLNLVSHFSSDPKVEEYLNKMADDTRTKPRLMAEMEESRARWNTAIARFLAMAYDKGFKDLLDKKAKD